jgi:hypothetical protein
MQTTFLPSIIEYNLLLFQPVVIPALAAFRQHFLLTELPRPFGDAQKDTERIPFNQLKQNTH